MEDTEDFVADSDVDSVRSSPLPLCGLSLLFKPRGRMSSQAFSEDSMSPIIPNRFPLSGKSSSQNESQNLQVKLSVTKEAEEPMFSDSESCISEVIIPLRNSMFPPFTPQHTHTFVTSEMVDTELSKKIKEEANPARDDGSETTAGGFYEEEHMTNKKASQESYKLRPGMTDGGGPTTGGGDSQTTIGGGYTEVEENLSKKFSQESRKSRSGKICADEEEEEKSHKKSSQESLKARSRNICAAKEDVDHSETTVGGCYQEEEENTLKKSSQESSKLRSKDIFEPHPKGNDGDSEASIGGDQQEDDNASGKSSQDSYRFYRSGDAVLSPGRGTSGREKKGKPLSQKSFRESLRRSTQVDIHSKKIKIIPSQNPSGSLVGPEQRGSPKNSRGRKKQGGHHRNSGSRSGSASIASSESSHLSDETQDPTNGQALPKKQRTEEGDGGRSKTVEDEPPLSQPLMTQQDTCVEVSQSQSLIDPQPVAIRKRLSGLFSSSQSSGGSDRSDSKTKDKEEKLKTHHDLELSLLEKLEKHQASAKSMASNASSSSAGKIQMLLVSLAPLMEQLKRAHTNERQHIKREREKNLNPSERSLLKLQITLMLERERRLLQIYKEHTELAGQVKDLREKALREKLNSSQRYMTTSQSTQSQQAQTGQKPCNIILPSVTTRKTSKKVKEIADSQSAVKRPMTKSIAESVPLKKTKLEASSGKLSTNPNQKASFSPPFKPTKEKTCKELTDGKSLSDHQETEETAQSPVNASSPKPGKQNVESASDGSEGADTTMAVISDNESVMSFEEYEGNEDASSNDDDPRKNSGETMQKTPNNVIERNQDVPAEMQAKEPDIGRKKFCSMKETAEMIQKDKMISSQVDRPKPILASERKLQFVEPEIVTTPTDKQPQMNIEQVVKNAMQNIQLQPSGFSSPPISALARDRNADNMSFGSPYSSIYGAATCPVTIPQGKTSAGLNSQIDATRVNVIQQRTILSEDQIPVVLQQPDKSASSGSQLKSYLVCPVSTASDKVKKTIITGQHQVAAAANPGKPAIISILSQPGLRGSGVISSVRQVGQARQALQIVHQTQIRPGSTGSKRQVSSGTVVTSSAAAPRSQVLSSGHVGPRQLMLPPRSNLTIQHPRPFDMTNAASQRLDVTRVNVSASTEQQPKRQVTSQQPGLPDLSELVTAGKIAPGHRVMTIESEGTTFHASLTNEGWIRGAGGEVFRTPMVWYKAVVPEAQKQVITKKVSYPKVLYNGVPLSEFSLAPSQMGNVGTSLPLITGTNQLLPNADQMQRTTHDVVMTIPDITMTSSVTGSTSSTHQAAPPSLSSLLRRCKVALHSRQELVPHSRWLPANFWTEADFNKVILPEALIAEVDCW